MIISNEGDESHDFLNTYIDLDPVIEILPNQIAKIDLACAPERNFQVNFRLSDNTYFTKNVTSTSPNINYCDSSYTPSEESEEVPEEPETPQELISECNNTNEFGFYQGDGSEGDPFGICDCDMLQNIENHLDSNFELLMNVNCEGESFNPIGEWLTHFEGSLKGNDLNISNITISNSDSKAAGIFSYATNAEFKNIKFYNIDVSNTASWQKTGGLVGILEDSNISDIYFQGTVNSTQREVGGLIGVIRQSSQLVKLNNNKINVNVSGTNNELGGVVGVIEGVEYFEFKNNEINLNISSDVDVIGGVSGALRNIGDGLIKENHFDLNITGERYIGGIFGEVDNYMYINHLLEIKNNSLKINFQGTDYIGGLVGLFSGGYFISEIEISENIIKGNILSVDGLWTTTGENVGGFIGSLRVPYSDLSVLISKNGFEGEIKSTSEYGEYLGGFIGSTSGTDDSSSALIEECYFKGDLICEGECFMIGGFIGDNTSAGDYPSFNVTNSYFLGNIESSEEDTWNLGGLFGQIGAGVVNEDPDSFNISNLYFSGDFPIFTGWSSDYGLVIGELRGHLNSGFDESFNYIYYNNYLEIEEGILPIGSPFEPIVGVGKIEGKTETELKEESTFTGWDFTEIWSIDSEINNSMPYLQWEVLD